MLLFSTCLSYLTIVPRMVSKGDVPYESEILVSKCLVLTFALFLSNTPAQDYTGWHLPEGARVRLGKGSIT